MMYCGQDCGRTSILWARNIPKCSELSDLSCNILEEKNIEISSENRGLLMKIQMEAKTLLSHLSKESVVSAKQVLKKVA